MKPPTHTEMSNRSCMCCAHSVLHNGYTLICCHGEPFEQNEFHNLQSLNGTKAENLPIDEIDTRRVYDDETCDEWQPDE